MIREDQAAWRQGYDAAWHGEPCRSPSGSFASGWSYVSGYIEGQAARARGIQGGVGLLNDGTVNVVEKGSPRLVPTIIDD